MSCAPFFCQVKDLMKIHNRDKFHQYSICSCHVKNFQSFAYRHYIHEMALFGRFFGPHLPKYGPFLPKIVTRKSILANKSIDWKLLWRVRSFMEKQRTQSVHFLSNLDLSSPLKMAKIVQNIFFGNTAAIGLSKYVKIKAVSLINTKNDYFFQIVRIKIRHILFHPHNFWATSSIKIFVPALSSFVAIGHKGHFRKILTGFSNLAAFHVTTPTFMKKLC